MVNQKGRERVRLAPFLFWEERGRGRQRHRFDLSVFAVEAVAAFAFQRYRFCYFQEGLGRVG